jgi:hypothetical protein
MNTTIGANQVVNFRAVGGSDTSATERSFINFFATPALSVDQTIGGNNIILNVASKWSSPTDPSFAINRLNVYVWRPSTNTKVGVIKDSAGVDITPPTASNLYPTANNTEQVTCLNIIPTSSVSALAGDVIICEIWGRTIDNLESADCSFYFDGGVVTTGSNNTASNHASFVEFNQDIQFATVPKTRLYFHDAAISLPGTLPSTEQSSRVPTHTWTGNSTLRVMNTTIGTSQVTASASISTDDTGIVTEYGYARFFCTNPIGVPVSISGFCTINVATSLSSFTYSNDISWGLKYFNIYLWRPATNAKVSTLFVGNTTYYANTTNSESVDVYYGVSLTTTTALAGDVIICEVWDEYENNIINSGTVSFHYDGTTANTTRNSLVTNHASFLEFNTIIPFASTTGANDSNFFLLL